MSKSGYFHCPHQLFPKVVDGSEMQKWLEGGEEAPTESDVWGDTSHPSRISLRFLTVRRKR